MKIAVAQPNVRIGDFEANAAAVLEWARRAKEEGARLLLCPARAVEGEPAGALRDHAEYWAQLAAALVRIRSEAPKGVCIVLGVSDRDGGDRGLVLEDGEVVADGAAAFAFDVDGVRMGVALPTLDAEALDRDVARLRDEGAGVVLLPDRLPFFVGGRRWVTALCGALARRHGVSVVRSQPVGANGSHVFEGGSWAVSATGETLGAAERFHAAVEVWDIDTSPGEGDRTISLPAFPKTPLLLAGEDTSDVIEALCLGIRDYVTKSGFERVVLGLSGGIDSAVVAVLAVRALGPDRVLAVLMPSRYTSTMSEEDATALAAALGIELRVVPIEPMVDAFTRALGGELGGLAAENLQARVRGVILMALSNQIDALVLNTGNKSEAAVGYSTMYGDMVGALGVIADLPKTWVYEVARWLNLRGAGIPPRVLARPPSAELRPGQTDQDSLPPYERIDRVLQRSLDEGWDLERLRAAHEDEEAALRTLGLLLGSAYKRRQAPPPIRVTLGGLHDRAYPLVHGFRFRRKKGSDQSSS